MSNNNSDNNRDDSPSIFSLSTDKVAKAGYEYPNAGQDNAAEEVQEAVERFRTEVSQDTKRSTPLLYWLLGTGTPEYKMSKEDAGYKQEPEGTMVCANCQYWYVGSDGEGVCSKVRGQVWESHWCRLWAADDMQAPNEKMQKAGHFDTLRHELQRAHEEQIWIDDLSKAPTMWQSDNDVPQFVGRWVEDAINLTEPVWDGQFSNVPITERYKVQEIISDSLTQPQGWSTASIANRLENEFAFLDKNQAQVIARQEVAAVLNKSREIAYRAEPDAEQKLFDWVGPENSSTTELCSDIKSEVNEMGGSVPLEQLKKIIKSKAEAYEYGTPDRAEEYIPHFQCRHTLMEREIEKIRKNRVYIDSPEEAPDDVQVQQGSLGGLYYDRDESSEPDEPNEPTDDLDISMSEAEDAIIDSIGSSDAEVVFDEASDEVFEEYARLSIDDDILIEGLAFNEGFDPGDDIIHPKTGRTTITDVIEDPFASSGPNAGFALTEDDVAIVFEFSQVKDEIRDDIETANLSETRQITEIEPIDRDAFDEENLEYDDTVEEKTVTGPKAKRLSGDQRRRFINELEDVSKQAADEIRRLQNDAKRSSYSTAGKEREKAFLSAAGIRDELDERNGDITSPEPSNELTQIAEIVTEQSQKAFREAYGESTTVSRGISEEAFKEMMREAINKDDDVIDVDTFGMTNYSTQKDVAETFAERRQTASINIEISPDNVLSWTDALFNVFNEGEVSIKGGNTEFSTADVTLPLGDRTSLPTLKEMLDNPTDGFIQLLSNNGLEELAVELEQKQ